MKTGIKGLRAVLLGAAAAAALTGAARAETVSAPVFDLSAQYENFYVIGDSLSDNGNIKGLTFGLFPGVRYFDGRFSNGPVWAELLGFDLGLNPALFDATLSDPASVDGISFAHGGATAQTIYPAPRGLSMRQQARAFGDLAGSLNVSGSDLGVVWGGNNDYFVGETDAAAVVDALAFSVDILAEAGLETIILPGVPTLGNTPAYANNPQERERLNAVSRDHNDALRVKAGELEASLGVDIVFVETGRLFDAIIARPEVFGFTNVTESCLDRGLVLDACGDENLFYDGVHPTRSGHELIARVFVASLIRESAPILAGRAQAGAGAQVAALQGFALRARFAEAREGIAGVSGLGAAADLGFRGERLTGARAGAASVYAFASHPDALAVAGGEGAGDIGQGLRLGLVGFDQWASERALFGAAVHFAREAAAFAEDPVGAAVDSAAGATVYGLFDGAGFEAGAWASVSVEGLRLRRASGLAELPLAFGRTQAVETRLGGRLSTEGVGPAGIGLTPYAEAVIAHRSVAGYRESGTFGLLDAAIEDQAETGLIASAGLTAHRRLAVSNRWALGLDGRFGLAAATNDALGLAAAIPSDVLTLEAASLAQTGLTAGVDLAVFERAGFTARLRSDVLTGSAGTQVGARLTGLWRF